MKSTLITFGVFIFILQSTFSQVPVKAGFEDWCFVQPISFEDVQCWESQNPVCSSKGLPLSVTFSEDAYKGTYALKLETGKDSMGMPSIAEVIFKDEVHGRPERLTGFYKADLKGDDYSVITISIASDRGGIGWGSLNIEKSTDIYYPFEIPIHYTSSNIKPDSMSIYIYSSADRPTTGTSIIVDELSLETMADVTIPLIENFTTRLNPNPATDEILVEVPDNIGMVTIKIFDNSGRLMEYQPFEYQIRINVSTFTTGLYNYEIRLKNHELYDKGRFRVAMRGTY